MKMFQSKMSIIFYRLPLTRKMYGIKLSVYISGLTIHQSIFYQN